MIEFLKLLVEQPESKNKVWLLAIRTILNVTFASKLYIWSVGKYQLIDFSSYVQWYEYMISGNALICIVLYFTSDVILFYFLNHLTLGILELVSYGFKKLKFRDRNYFNALMTTLSTFDLVSFNSKSEKVSAGKKTIQILSFINLFIHEEGKAEIANIKKSFANNLIHTLFVSIIIYLSCVSINTVNILIPVILITSALVLTLNYGFINVLFNYAMENAEPLSKTFQGIMDEKIARDLLGKVGIYFHEYENPKKIGF